MSRLPGLRRAAFQVPLLLLALVMAAHGFFGPELAPKNLATTLSWVHYRGVLVLALLAAGNVFCFACPFTLVRDFARRWVKPFLPWPRFLRNKWPAVALFVLMLFAYELFDLWSSPWLTAWVIVGYFAAALAVDTLFKRASFCKYLCPIGQFNFVASTLSPLEVRVREPDRCLSCKTHDCIRGTRSAAPAEFRRGCELGLFQPRKAGNMDCTFCLDCVQACPHDNVGLFTRLPGAELWSGGTRSGIGRFETRKDLAALAALFAFAAVLNAFAMVSPAYALEQWLAGALGVRREAPVLGVLFVVGLVLEPLLLLGLAAYAARGLAGAREPISRVLTRNAYALIPVGFGIWLAHYGFHFFTGLFAWIPALHGLLADLGLPGPVRYGPPGLPESAVYPLELGFVGLGALGSCLVSHRLAAREGAPAAGIPFSLLSVLLGAAAVWILSQPMEMRGTSLLVP